MHQMPIDIEQASAIVVLTNNVSIPKLVVQSFPSQRLNSLKSLNHVLWMHPLQFINRRYDQAYGIDAQKRGSNHNRIQKTTQNINIFPAVRHSFGSST
jgi:hypothetical protein